jgi:hypothetical protein
VTGEREIRLHDPAFRTIFDEKLVAAWSARVCSLDSSRA